LPLSVPTARLAVVGEVLGQQAVDGADVALVDRLAVEAPYELLTVFRRHASDPHSDRDFDCATS
jgi:hypothetical protein